MASVNKVILVGNLGADPTVRQTQNGGVIAQISVATSERWTDKNTGEQKESVEWHNITFFNRLAEIARDYLRKGSSVYVEGSLHTEKYTDNNGVERYATKIHAQTLQMLGSRQDSGQGQAQNGGQGQQQEQKVSYQRINTPQAPQQPPRGQQYATYADGQPIYPPQPTQGRYTEEDVPF